MDFKVEQDFDRGKTKFIFEFGMSDLAKIPSDKFDFVCKAGQQYQKVSDKLTALLEMVKVVEENDA